jgi:hypothetical protein
MGIRNLNALKPWNEPSDAGYDTGEDDSDPPPDHGHLSFRSVEVDEIVEVDEADVLLSAWENMIFSEDAEDGTYFFVQLEGYEDGASEDAPLWDETNETPSGVEGFMAVILENNENSIPIEDAPVDSYYFIAQPSLEDASSVAESALDGYGLTVEIVSTYGAMVSVDHPIRWGSEFEIEGFRSVALDETVVLTGIDWRFFQNGFDSLILDDEGYFFIQLEGYEGGDEDVVAPIDAGGSVSTGFLGVITSNDESVRTLSDVPIGSYRFFEADSLSAANALIDDYAFTNGIEAEIASTFGALFSSGTSAHFEIA